MFISAETETFTPELRTESGVKSYPRSGYFLDNVRETFTLTFLLIWDDFPLVFRGHRFRSHIFPNSNAVFGDASPTHGAATFG